MRCRSAVERDGYSREIELIPEPEAPTRLIIVLAQLLDGLDAIGADRDEAWRVVTRCALDSIPAIRRAVINLLAANTDGIETTAAAERLGYPTSTTRRTLEDLTAHNIAHRHKGGTGTADNWTLGEWAREKCAAVGIPETSVWQNNGAVPETSEPLSFTLSMERDKSGTVLSSKGAQDAPDEPTRAHARQARG